MLQLNRKDYLGTALTRQGYHFDYDAWGNTTKIYVGAAYGDTSNSLYPAIWLAEYEYNVNGTISKMTYANGDYVLYGYDSLDRLISEVYHRYGGAIEVEYQYIYNANGQLAKQQSLRNGTVTESYSFEYDSLGRLIRSREEGGSGIVQRTEHLYDTANRLSKQSWVVGARNFSEEYSYDSVDGNLSSMKLCFDEGTGTDPATNQLTYTYDGLNRLTQVLNTQNYVTPMYTRNYGYKDYDGSGSRTTGLLDSYVYRKPSDDSIISGNAYDYDANGNITTVYEVFGSDQRRPIAEYTYDSLNQLKTETRKTYTGSSATPTTTTVVTYTIDTAGNISSVETKVNGVVTNTVGYAYGNNYWSDRLTAITANGVTKSIHYTYYGGGNTNPNDWYNGTDYTNLTWTQGRRLSSITKGSSTYSYEYDMSGVRSVKIVDGWKHEYVTQNGKVIRDKVTDASTGAFQYVLEFGYDESGRPLTLRWYYNEAETWYNAYYYICNAQGDVVKLVSDSGATIAAYSYDAWGALLSIQGESNGDAFIAYANPLRYRGYYYDTETGFYYLQSRYYDPIVKRFLNADSYGSTGQGFLGYNMFSYCQNNPAVCIDNGGQFPIWLALFMDHVFGYIHRLVQMDIRLKHAGEGISIEQGLYLGDKAVARADVVDLDSGEIWEIKTVKSGRVAALGQLRRYFKSNLKVSEKGPRAIPGDSGMFPGRFSGSFPLICGNEACGIDTYYVIYYTPEPGVILYDVRKAMLTQEEFANAKVYVPKFARQTSLAYSGTPTYATYALRAAAYAGAFYCGYKLCEALLGCLMVACLA